MSSQQPARPFFRLGSFRPMQNTYQPPPPPAPAPQPSIIRPAVPRFRTPANQTTPPQEPAPTEQPKQNRPPAAPTPPPIIETKPAVAQPQAPPTNPAPSPPSSPSLPSAVAPAPAAPRFRTPATQPAPPSPSLPPAVVPAPAAPRFRTPATQTAPPSPSLPPAVAPAPAGPRFRTPMTQTTPPQETAPTAPPRQIGLLAVPAPPPSTETRPTVAQPQAPPTNPALNSSPAPLPASVIQTTSPSLPSAVTPSPTPLVRAPPTQPNLATSKPVSPQPRFVASSTPSSSITKTETVMQSSPQRAAAAPVTVSSPRFLTDKSATRTSTPPSPGAPKPQANPSVTSASPKRESSALGNSFIRKSYPEHSTTPNFTSPVRKVSAPSPESKTVLGSRSPPPSEPLPTAVPASIVPDRGYSPASSPRNGKMLSKTPPHSPLMRPLSSPPSPLTLPPAQIKTAINHVPNTVPKDQSTVMTQDRNGKPKIKPRVPDTYEFMETTYKYIGHDGEGKDMHKKNAEAELSGMKVIKLVGENHGAIMELSPSHTKGSPNGRKTGTDNGKGNKDETTNTKTNKSMAIHAPPMTAFMNSNVQGMNNSIVYNTSCTHNDPGVHLSFSRKPNGGYVKDHTMD